MPPIIFPPHSLTAVPGTQPPPLCMQHPQHGTVVLKQTRFRTYGPDLEARFSEANAFTHIYDPVVQYLGLYDTRGSICIVSPYLAPGPGNLEQYLRANNDCDKEAILARVASGLLYLHELGIVHGNLHHRNVIMCHCGNALLTDFGLRGITSDDATTSPVNTLQKNASETAIYRAPEEYGEDQLPSTSGDVYSFAMLIVFVYNRGQPLTDIGGLSTADIIERLRGHWRPERDDIINAEFPDDVWVLVQQCWEPRWESAPNRLDPRPTMTVVHQRLL
ncbi:kinase-like protein [Auricularia subglabra TFB-10046 SS5]|nr:kinase-like protein [Auricularia subglabra TFB-10046 SS5]